MSTGKVHSENAPKKALFKTPEQIEFGDLFRALGWKMADVARALHISRSAETIIHDPKKRKASSAAASAAGKKAKPFVDAHLAKLRARAASGESSPSSEAGERPDRKGRPSDPSPPGSKVPPPGRGGKGRT